VLSFFSDASEETRVELQRRVELDGGNIDGRSQPIKQKRAHPSVQFSTHNGSHGPILFFFLPAPSFSAQNVRVGALMAAGDKTVKDLGYLSKNQGMAAAMPRHTGSSATAGHVVSEAEKELQALIPQQQRRLRPATTTDWN